jgi:hypothetical protein
MARQDPHHRVTVAQQAITAGAVPIDLATRALAEVIQGVSKNDALKYAWDKYQVHFERNVIESYLIADTTIEEMSRATGVSAAALAAYRDHIFDIGVFRDRLERISYVARCRALLPRDQQAYLEAALVQGTEYINWLINRQSTVPPRKVLEAAMTEGLYMGLAHRGTDPTSERSKQAQHWLQSGTQAATTLLRLDPHDDEDALEHLRIALVHKNHVTTPQMAGAPLPEDIVH